METRDDLAKLLLFAVEGLGHAIFWAVRIEDVNYVTDQMKQGKSAGPSS